MNCVYTLCEIRPMETMGDRLKSAREKLYPSARKAATKHNWPPSTYAAHENGQNEFGPEEARRYSKAFKTKASWLLTGESEPGIAAVEAEQPYDDRPDGGIVEIDVRAGLGGGGTDEGLGTRVQGDYADPVKPEAWRFPARFMREEIRAPESRVIVIETTGDSMTPTILSGDRVIVDTGHTIPSPDGIYAIRDQYGFIVVKRLQVLRKEGRRAIRIISDNTSHHAEDVGEDEIEIVGRVLWSLKRL